MSLMDAENDPAENNPAENDPAENNPAPEPEWRFSENLPGEGPAPEWFKKDKYGTVEEQAKAYKELEQRFGSFTGAPRDGKYSINLAEELTEKGVSIDADDPLYSDAVEFAKESNMSQDGFDKMMNLYATALLAEQAALQQFQEDQFKSLGDNAQARITNLVNWGKANLPADLYQGFQEMAVSANAVKTMEKLISLTRSAPIDPANAIPKNGTSDEELRKMQFEKDEHGNRRLSVDPEFRKKFKKLSEEVWGAGEHRVVING